MSIIYKDQPCPACGNYTNRGVSVDAIILKEGKILLVKRGSEPFKGFWATPGGYIGWNETAEEAVKREVKEETGLRTRRLRFLNFSSLPERHPSQVINFVYMVTTEGVIRKGDDAEDLKWFDINNLPDKLAFDHRENVNRALNQIGD